MLWKTPWGKRAPYSEMPYIIGFDTDSAAQFYTADPDPIAIDPIAGSAFGFVVAMNALPVPSPGVIAQSGDPNEGWELSVETVAASPPTVRFRFRVFGGAGEVGIAQSQNIPLTNVDPLAGDPAPIFVPLMTGFAGTAQFGGNGAIFIVNPSALAATPGQGEYTEGALSAPYVNANPILRVGIDASGTVPLAQPNGIHGLVGAKATWPALAQANAQNIYDQWYPSIVDGLQIVVLPSSTLGGGVVPNNLAGWRAPLLPSGSISPTPLSPFVGAATLTRAVDPVFALFIELASPARFFPENLLFPFGAT